MCTYITSFHISFKIILPGDYYCWVCFLSWHTPRNWQWGLVKNEFLRQKGWFQFSHCELSFICSNIPEAPANGVYISQLIRYSSACGTYPNFIDRELHATNETATEPMVPTKIALDHFMQVREISIILLWLLRRHFASEEQISHFIIGGQSDVRHVICWCQYRSVRRPNGKQFLISVSAIRLAEPEANSWFQFRSVSRLNGN